MEEVSVVYELLRDSFMQKKDRGEIIGHLLHFGSAWLRAGTLENLFLLKQKLETEFPHDVGCKYAYVFAPTPNAYGCDLREILFNTDLSMRVGTPALLHLFRLAATAAPFPHNWWHILTDVDDTLYATGGALVAGSDVSWRRNAPYPGILSFYATFHRNPGCTAYSTVLSAAPGILKGQHINDARLKHILGPSYGFLQGVDEKSQLLRNALISTWKWPAEQTSPAAVKPLYRAYADTKFERFSEYSRIFPEYKYIFIGDNGKGDVITGLRMLSVDSTCIVCIHRVCQDGISYRATYPLPAVSGVAITKQMSDRLFDFKNYYELACIFYSLGIFSRADVKRVAAETRLALRNPENIMFAPLYATAKLKKKKVTTKMKAQ